MQNTAKVLLSVRKEIFGVLLRFQNCMQFRSKLRLIPSGFSSDHFSNNGPKYFITKIEFPAQRASVVPTWDYLSTLKFASERIPRRSFVAGIRWASTFMRSKLKRAIEGEVRWGRIPGSRGIRQSEHSEEFAGHCGDEHRTQLRVKLSNFC